VRENIEKDWFNVIVIILILINTIFLAAEYDGMPRVLIEMLEASNICFTVVFSIEMAVKLFGFGIKDYVSDGFNCFDGIIVILGMVELARSIEGGNSNSQGITVLRTFRLLKDIQDSKKLENSKGVAANGDKCKSLLHKFKSLQQIANVGTLMFLLLFVYTLIGMQFFSAPLTYEDGTVARYNFGSFAGSMVTIFIVSAFNQRSSQVKIGTK